MGENRCLLGGRGSSWDQKSSVPVAVGQKNEEQEMGVVQAQPLTLIVVWVHPLKTLLESFISGVTLLDVE